MKRPKLTARLDKIELDQVSVLIDIIHATFKDAFGTYPDPNDWDSLRIQAELSDLFTPDEFNRLFASEVGRGVIVGAWITEYIMTDDDTADLYDDEI